MTKTDFHTKLQSLNKKINSNKTKHLLVESELKKQKKIDTAYFRDKNYFDGDGTQSYLVFQPMHKYFKIENNNSNEISLWKSKGLSNEKVISIKTFGYNQALKLVYDNARIKLRFARDLSKQNKSYTQSLANNKHLHCS